MIIISKPLSWNSYISNTSAPQVDQSETGLIRARRFRRYALHELNAVWEQATKAQAEEAVRHYWDNRAKAFPFEWFDGRTYQCRFATPPTVQYQAYENFTVICKLTGYQQQ